MSSTLYRFEFAPSVASEDVEASLVLAIMAAESLYGEPLVRLEARHFFDPEQRACVVDASTPVGASFNKLFTGFLTRETGADSFTVRAIQTKNEMGAAAH